VPEDLSAITAERSVRDVPVNKSARCRLEQLLRLRDRLNIKIAQAALKLEQEQNAQH
jgi:hypothetical protein